MNAHPWTYYLSQPQAATAACHVSLLSHSWIKPIPQQILHYFPLLISIWQDFNLRFIPESSPENHNAIGSAFVDNLLWKRPRLKCGLFYFVTMKVKFFLKSYPSEQKALYWFWSTCLFLRWWYWVWYLRQSSHRFHQKSQTSGRSYNLTANHLGMHTSSSSSSILCTLVCVYRINFWWIILYEI